MQRGAESAAFNLISSEPKRVSRRKGAIMAVMIASLAICGLVAMPEMTEESTVPDAKDMTNLYLSNYNLYAWAMTQFVNFSLVRGQIAGYLNGQISALSSNAGTSIQSNADALYGYSGIIAAYTAINDEGEGSFLRQVSDFTGEWAQMLVAFQNAQTYMMNNQDSVIKDYQDAIDNRDLENTIEDAMELLNEMNQYAIYNGISYLSSFTQENVCGTNFQYCWNAFVTVSSQYATQCAKVQDDSNNNYATVSRICGYALTQIWISETVLGWLYGKAYSEQLKDQDSYDRLVDDADLTTQAATMLTGVKVVELSTYSYLAFSSFAARMLDLTN